MRADRQTERRDEDNNHLHSQFREPRLKLPKLYALTSSRNDISVLCHVWSADVQCFDSICMRRIKTDAQLQCLD